MQLYLILLPILYLVVSYISIYKMPTIFTRILRIIMGILLLFDSQQKIGGYLLYYFYLLVMLK